MACWVVGLSLCHFCFNELFCWNVCWLAGSLMIVLKACFISEAEDGSCFWRPELWFGRPSVYILARAPFWYLGRGHQDWCCFFVRTRSFVPIFESKLGCLGLSKQCYRIGHFSRILVPWGQVSKFMVFRVVRSHLWVVATHIGGGKCIAPRALNHQHDVKHQTTNIKHQTCRNQGIQKHQDATWSNS